MARYRAYVVLAVGALLIVIGFAGDSADWAKVVQIVAGVILLVDGAVSVGRESDPKR